MITRILGSAGVLTAAISLAVSAGTSVSGQERPAPPSLVITAFAGKPVDYKAPRTPWGDPDLQGVWSSDSMENVPMAVGRGGRGRGGGAQAPAGPQPLYLDEQAFAARVEQVKRGATQRDSS